MFSLNWPWFNYWFSFTLAYSRISHEYSSLFIIVIKLIFMFSLWCIEWVGSLYVNWIFMYFCIKSICVEVLRPSQPNVVMSSAVSLPNHTFTGQAYSYKWITSIVHILSPETDKCPSWISGRERMTVENISWSISTKECCRPRRGLNPRPPVSSWHPTEPLRPAY